MTKIWSNTKGDWNPLTSLERIALYRRHTDDRQQQTNVRQTDVKWQTTYKCQADKRQTDIIPKVYILDSRDYKSTNLQKTLSRFLMYYKLFIYYVYFSEGIVNILIYIKRWKEYNMFYYLE